MALIYKITNSLTDMSYIGKTTRTLQIRINEHKRDCKNYSGTTIPLYNAIQNYGWDNFSIEILEDNILNSDIDEKEKYYIKKYNTYYNGYNATEGGEGGRTSSKLTLDFALEIISLLKDPNNLESIPSIADKYHIDSSVVSNINTGKTWRQDDEIYPLRNYKVAGLSLTKEDYKNVVNEILNTNKTLTEIGQKYNLSENQMTAINQGYECYNSKNIFYQGIYTGSFPIRQSKNKKLNLDNQIQNIIYDILFTKDSMAKIGAKYNIAGGTLNYIQMGQRQKHLTQDFLVPLRKNIIENQKIYLKKYGEVK